MLIRFIGDFWKVDKTNGNLSNCTNMNYLYFAETTVTEVDPSPQADEHRRATIAQIGIKGSKASYE